MNPKDSHIYSPKIINHCPRPRRGRMLRINFVRITVSILYIGQKHFHKLNLLIDRLIRKETEFKSYESEGFQYL